MYIWNRKKRQFQFTVVYKNMTEKSRLVHFLYPLLGITVRKDCTTLKLFNIFSTSGISCDWY